ncbi:hypothetical protein ACFY3N_09950 [Streptomyces sp. NPDC000348]|uniref:hypothetical protein n=1 Tax=Streptomyces sp. NPDC000348 TaxID=3364538 RepID=UPI0036D12644
MKTNLDALLTALYVFIDDHVAPRRRIGRPPKLTDAELLCLAVARVLLGFPSARHWIRFAHARLGHLFRYLPQQSAYNKRLNAARPLISQRKPASSRPSRPPRTPGGPWHGPRGRIYLLIQMPKSRVAV